MIDPPPPSHREGFQPATLPEASRLLGVSESTGRRMVKAGRLEAERVLRPQGHVWMVMVPLPSTDPSAGSRQRSTSEGVHPPPGDALAMWTRSVLEPLVAELSLMRQANERQAQQLIGQAETIGRQGAELERAASTVVALGDELAAAEASRGRDHRRLRIGLAVAGVLAAVAGVAPVWVR